MNNTEEYTDYEEEGITARDFHVLFQDTEHPLLPSPGTRSPPQSMSSDVADDREEETTVDQYDDLNVGTTDDALSPDDDTEEDEDGIIVIGTDYNGGA